MVRGTSSTSPDRRTRSKIYDYFIHDNGGRPFGINVTGNLATITKFYDFDQDSDAPPSSGEQEPLDLLESSSVVFQRAGRYSKAIVRIQKVLPMRDDYTGDNDFDGRSVFLAYLGLGQSGMYRYLYVQRYVHIFEFEEELKAFHSYIGNNDVPYSFAFSDSFAYLFEESVRIPLTLVPGPEADCDPYQFYYGQGETALSYKLFPKYSKYSYDPVSKRFSPDPKREPILQSENDSGAVYLFMTGDLYQASKSPCQGFSTYLYLDKSTNRAYTFPLYHDMLPNGKNVLAKPVIKHHPEAKNFVESTGRGGRLLLDDGVELSSNSPESLGEYLKYPIRSFSPVRSPSSQTTAQ
jgi:hypothetical protein